MNCCTCAAPVAQQIKLCQQTPKKKQPATKNLPRGGQNLILRWNMFFDTVFNSKHVSQNIIFFSMFHFIGTEAERNRDLIWHTRWLLNGAACAMSNMPKLNSDPLKIKTEMTRVSVTRKSCVCFQFLWIVQKKEIFRSRQLSFSQKSWKSRILII